MAAKKKPMCKFGAKCYRKNPQHKEEYAHPGDEEEEAKAESEPPKKKTKIDEFFAAKGDTSPKAKKAAPADNGDTAKDKEEEKPGVGNTSGYCRAESSDEEQEEKGKEDKPDADEQAGSDTEEEEAPASPADVKENIKQKFLVEMPDDFYHFWEFAKSVNSKNPTDAFKGSLGLQLVGPFDVLANNCVKRNKQGKRPCYLRHWRYYYDPPEFLTVVKGDDATQFHMGYYRDDPAEMPVFVAVNSAANNCNISPKGENLFAAFSWFIDDLMKKEKPQSTKDKLKKLKNEIRECAERHGMSLELKTKAMKARDKKVVCSSFHGAGLVVPVDKNEVGYRPVPETPADLKKMFKKIVEASSETECNKAFDPVMELISLVQFANDECDYGEGLELGIDLFCYGGEVLHPTIMNLLPLAYQLLRRPQYASIIEAHLKDRRKGSKLSQLE